MLIFAIISDSEVKLNDYKYPPGAHIFGWIIVALLLCPIPAFFIYHVQKVYKKSRFFSFYAVSHFI